MGKIGSNKEIKEKVSSPWLREKAAQTFNNIKAIEMLAGIIKGDKVDRHVLSDGSIVDVQAAAKDKIKCLEILKSWGFGDGDQTLTIKMEFVADFVSKVMALIARVVPTKCKHCGTGLDIRERIIDGLEKLEDQGIEG